MPGVVAVLTAAELGVAPQKGVMSLNDAYLRPPLAESKVMATWVHALSGIVPPWMLGSLGPDW